MKKLITGLLIMGAMTFSLPINAQDHEIKCYKKIKWGVNWAGGVPFYYEYKVTVCY